MKRRQIGFDSDVADRRQQIAATNSLDGLHDQVALRLYLRRVREVHQVAAAADAEMDARWFDATQSWGNDPDQPCSCATFGSHNLYLVAGRAQRNEEHPAFMSPEAESAGDDPLDSYDHVLDLDCAHGSLVRYLTIWDTDCGSDDCSPVPRPHP